MRSSEVDRLRHRWRIVAGSLVLALVYALLAAVPAYATVLSTPDAGGFYAHCNVDVYYDSGLSANAVNDVACQYSLGSGGSVPAATVTNLTLGTQTVACTSTCSGSGPSVLNFTAFCTQNSAGHATRLISQAGGSCGGPFAKSGNNITSATLTGACTISITSVVTNGSCHVDNYGVNATGPPLPTDFYTGSSAGPALDADKGTSVCSRTLTDTSSMTGEFTSSRTSMVNATVTAWDWNWGDSTTHGTLQNQNHTYGALSTMPTNGWTAVITMTVTAASGHLFSDGSTSQTGTCSLRVDFLHPENMTAGSTGGSGTGDATLDSCIPSGWNIVNPIALIGGMGCVLRVLFVPSSTTVSNLGHLWDTATTHVPFSIVNDVVTYIPNSLDDMQDGIAAHSPILGYNHDVSASVARSPVCDAGAGGINVCGTGGYPFFGTYFDIHGFAGCSGSGCEVGNTIPIAARTVLMFVITAMFIYACWRGAGEILK